MREHILYTRYISYNKCMCRCLYMTLSLDMLIGLSKSFYSYSLE